MALLLAFIFMHHAKIPANLLSLGAIDFGILVDGAVVVVENILRRREADQNRPLTPKGAPSGHPFPVARPLFFGMPRKIFHNPVLHRLVRPMTASWAWPWAALAGPAGAVVASLLALGVLAGTMGRDFLPYLDEGSIWLQVQMPPGITLDKARDMADALRSAALEFPEVSYIVTQTGRNVTAPGLLDALAHRGQRGPASLWRMEVGPDQAAADREDGRALRPAARLFRGLHAAHDRRLGQAVGRPKTISR
ncbi:TBC1 domain family member 1 [Manis javanica]|nr:TBC1 domain family member 1 [Manis javanica]